MKKKKIDKNYLERIPVHPENIPWKTDENGIVTLEIENKGAMNRIAQKLFKKPKVSYIHLDKTGSFVWLSIDGNKSIYDIALLLEENFGNNSHPLYERITKFFFVLEKNGFIIWAK